MTQKTPENKIGQTIYITQLNNDDWNKTKKCGFIYKAILKGWTGRTDHNGNITKDYVLIEGKMIMGTIPFSNMFPNKEKAKENLKEIIEEKIKESIEQNKKKRKYIHKEIKHDTKLLNNYKIKIYD